ncbi:MAG: hypothetical protein RMK80_08890, partial [Pseudobdellovibrionaceae bacterium]|nr:hypothetical protein [Pseudobdellovibrionaceae bacterium]
MLPKRWRYGLAKMLAYVVFHWIKFRWFTILRNIRIVFPQKSKNEIYTLFNKSTENLAYYFLQYFEVAQNPQNIPGRFCIFGEDNLTAAKKLNRGYFLLACHLGNPDMALKGLSLINENVTLISKNFSVTWTNQVWFYVRHAPHIHYLPPHSPKTAYEVFKALGQKRGVIFVL